MTKLFSKSPAMFKDCNNITMAPGEAILTAQKV